MSTCRFCHAFVIAIALMSSQGLRAGTISLSSIDDLANVQVGDSVTVDVLLSGLVAGESLDFLSVTVAIDGNAFGLPTITEGSIVPDSTGFLQAPSSGIADGLYDSLFSFSGLPIETNGVFFSFEVTANNAGTGTFSISFADAATGFDPFPIDPGASLSFDVQSTTPIVPEPSSWVLFGLGGFGLIAGKRFTNRKNVVQK